MTDRAGAVAMAAKWRCNLARVERVLADASYTGKQFTKDLHEAIGATVEVVKRSELHSFKVLPKRSRGRAFMLVAGAVPQALEAL